MSMLTTSEAGTSSVPHLPQLWIEQSKHRRYFVIVEPTDPSVPSVRVRPRRPAVRSPHVGEEDE